MVYLLSTLYNQMTQQSDLQFLRFKSPSRDISRPNLPSFQSLGFRLGPETPKSWSWIHKSRIEVWRQYDVDGVHCVQSDSEGSSPSSIWHEMYSLPLHTRSSTDYVCWDAGASPQPSLPFKLSTSTTSSKICAFERINTLMHNSRKWNLSQLRFEYQQVMQTG